MTDHIDDKTKAEPAAQLAANEQRPPERELELKLKKNPEDLDCKTDVGSDKSMDASDPIASTQPGNGEPAPSSTFPEDSSRD